MNFYTADWHLSHTNIVRGVSSWPNKDECRNFQTIEEMNDLIINNCNKVVKPSDTLYIVGDFALTSLNKWPGLRSRVKCENIHLILGNHDPKKELLSNKSITESVRPLDLFVSISNYKTTSPTPKLKIILSHYSFRSWDRCHHGSWMLYGHDHGELEPYLNKKGEFLKTMDIGVDTNIFTPYSEEEISKLFENRPNLYVGHHKGNR
jgi:calcineurin-like phosphoesterase family protein